MALSVSIIKRNVVGDQRQVVADVTFDNSYPTGGESFTVNDVDPFGASTATVFKYVKAEQKGVASRICEYDYANKKLMLFTALSTEAANASDQSTIVVRVLGQY